MSHDEFEVPTDRFLFLSENGIPESAIPIVVSGAAYFDHMKGVSAKDYWKSAKFDNRDEFFVLLNAYFGLAGKLSKFLHNNEWRLNFDVAYLFQIKSTAQAALSINLLTNSYCYADAFSVCRTMISRLNLLVLCALNPTLFDSWLKNPKDERFLDGHIRDELINNGIPTVPHLYELASEVIHSQARALSDIGYFQEGLFVEIPAIRNQVYVIAKFIVAMAYQTMLSMAIQDCDGKVIPQELKDHDELFEFLKRSYLVHNRWDHFIMYPKNRAVD